MIHILVAFLFTHLKVNMTWPIPDFVLLTLMLQIPSENKNHPQRVSEGVWSCWLLYFCWFTLIHIMFTYIWRLIALDIPELIL